MKRAPGLSVRLKLTLSYAGFLMVAGALMLVAAWLAGRQQQSSDFLLRYVPDGVISQALYFRGGNSSDQLIIAVLLRDGVPMRYFPIGAKSDVHVPLRVVEDIEGGSVVELQIAAPLGVSGTVVVDLGMVEH